jgi:hypothetical protein
MDQVQKELADMRERMDQFMTLMTGMAEGQEKLREFVEQPRPDPEVEIPSAEGNPGNPGNADNPVNTGNAGNANADGNPGNVGNTGNVGNGIGGRYNVNQGIRINGHPVTEDYQYDQFSLHDEALETTRRMDELAEKLKSLESQNSLGFDVTNLGLVQGVRIPHKFKPPTFEKYNGASCPFTHLQSYLGRLGAHTEDEKLWMYYFEDSLTGASREWYSHLSRTTIKSWKDLAEAFVKQYQYNLDMAPNRTLLQGMSQTAKETFREYAQRWRQIVASVQPPMSEREMADMFMNTLQGNYIERLAACLSINFAEIVIVGERIESLLKMGRIQDNSASNSSGPKRPFAGNGQRRKEGETSVVYAGRGRGRGRPNYYQDQVAAVTIPTPVPQPQYHPQQQPRYNNQQQGGNPGQQRHYQQRPRQTDRVIEPIPMPYSVLLPKLIDMNLVTLRTLAPPIDPNNLPRGYDVNARCAFHSNAPGHTTDNCKALQLKVQDLRDAQAINFAPVPNVIQNPMPAHGGQRINVVDSGETLNLVSDVTKVKTSLSVVKDRLLKGQIFPGCGEEC